MNCAPWGLHYEGCARVITDDLDPGGVTLVCAGYGERKREASDNERQREQSGGYPE